MFNKAEQHFLIKPVAFVDLKTTERSKKGKKVRGMKKKSIILMLLI